MESYTAWALFILLSLLILALFASYLLQHKKIQAIHETVLSIFAGMAAGLIIKLTGSQFIQDTVRFDYQFFFNLLLPPIILASGYELHQANFFRNIGTIFTFAFAGTFISAITLGLFLWICTRIPLDGFQISFVEAISVGATLSATDPVTILAIFNTYKVDPKLYTVIFGESILNDAIAIVIFDTAQRYRPDAPRGKSLTVGSLFEAFGIFFLVFFGSLLIGVLVGVGTALMLKFTLVRRFPKIESCLIILIAYASYYFANGVFMSGIVSLLFCGITLKHYAYYNMSRRTQLTTKYMFAALAQLSENFIFIYLGLTLFTETSFKPVFLFMTVIGICLARWCAVFPLSKAINWFIRYRSKRRGVDVADELPYSHQVMLFWAGLRGAVGVALAAGLTGPNRPTLQATVLVVVVLTVIIFGGTTARMLEIMGIRIGVVDEIDSDDEFDIETTSNGTYYRSNAVGFDNRAKGDSAAMYNKLGTRASMQLSSQNNVHLSNTAGDEVTAGYSSGTPDLSPPVRPTSRNNSTVGQRDRGDGDTGGRPLSYTHPSRSSFIASSGSTRDAAFDAGLGTRRDDIDMSTNDRDNGNVNDSYDNDDDIDEFSDSDLPPAAKRTPLRKGPAGRTSNLTTPTRMAYSPRSQQADSAPAGRGVLNDPIVTAEGADETMSPSGRDRSMTASGAIQQLFSGTTDEQAAWFKQLDEGFIKPKLLLDQNRRSGV